MTVGQGGARRWPRVCLYCDRTYILTNWMRRGRTHGWNSDTGEWENTHTLGCRARSKARKHD
jgi:hypothetical protein